MIDTGLVGLNGFSFITSTGAGRGAARAEDAQGTPTQSRISPSILDDEEKTPSKTTRRPSLIAAVLLPAKGSTDGKSSNKDFQLKAKARVSKPRPESGLDCLICATFARQRVSVRARGAFLSYLANARHPRPYGVDFNARPTCPHTLTKSRIWLFGFQAGF